MVGKPIAGPGATARRVTIGQVLLPTTLGYTPREIGARTGMDTTTIYNELCAMLNSKPALVEREEIESTDGATRHRYRLTEFARGQAAA